VREHLDDAPAEVAEPDHEHGVLARRHADILAPAAARRA
jgi:hypothetical protein